MKILKIMFLIFFALILLAAAGGYVFVKTFDLRRYKPQIIEQIAKTVHRQVTLGDLALGIDWTRGVRIEMSDLKIKDDPVFSGGDFLFAGQILLDVDVARLIAKKEISLSRIEMRSLRLALIRDRNGALNIPLAAGAKASASAGVAGTTTSAAQTAAVPVVKNQPPVLPVNVAVIRVTDARISFVDQLASPPLNLTVDQLSLDIREFSLSQRFPFRVQLAEFSPSPNFSAEGFAQLNIEKGRVQFSQVRILGNLGTVSADKLVASIPQLVAAGLQGLDGKLTMDVAQLEAGAAGVEDLDFKGNFSDGKMVLKSLTKPVEAIGFQIAGGKENLRVEHFSARLGSGDLRGRVTLQDYLRNLKYDFEANGQGILLQEILPPFPQNIQPEGTVVFQLNGSGGLADSVDPLKAVSASSKFSVQAMKLKNFNPIRMLFDRISIIPGLYDKVMTSLSPQQQAKLAQPDMVFERVEGEGTFLNGMLSVNSLEAISDQLLLHAQAKIDLRLNLEYSGQVGIPKDFSDGIVKGAPELSGLLDEKGQIEIPLLPFKGPVAAVTVLPDMGFIGKRIAVSEGKKQIENLIDKAWGGTKSPLPQGEGEGSSDSAEPKKAIKGLLDSILKQIK